MTTLEYRSPEWIAERREGIGSSDVAAIVGLSPWKSPYALWAEKVGLVEDELQAETDSMEFGRRIEPVLAQWFHDRTGLHILGEQTMCRNPDREWMRCSVDGFVAESAETAIADCLGVAEMKSTGGAADEWAEELPDHYVAQTQWLMAVTGYDYVWLPTLHFAFGRREFRVHEVKRDEANIAYLVGAAERFWVDNVLAGAPPETDGSESTTRALRAAWKGDPELEVDLTDHAALLDEWRAAKDDAKAADDHVEATANAIRALMGEASEGIVRGQLAVSWRPQTAKRFNAKALQEVHPELIEAFTKTTETRILRAHKTTKEK